MIEASKTAVLSSQPTKRGWKAWLLGLAVVVAVVTIALLANAPRKEPVRVWFVRATNEAGGKRLVFEGTNGSERQLQLNFLILTGEFDPKNPQAGIYSLYSSATTNIAARQTVFLTLGAPEKDTPYIVSWGVDPMKPGPTRLQRARMTLCDFLSDHGMDGLAFKLTEKVETHTIPSTEIKE